MSAPGRRWLELRARVDTGAGGTDGEAQDLLAFGLVEVGGRAVEERDGWLVSHLQEPDDVEDFVEEVRALLATLVAPHAVEVDWAWQDHEDWAETWKRGLDTRRLTPRLVVTPTWIPVTEAPGEVVLVLDPGMAFGTAEHGTTRGCLRLLDRAVEPGDRVLDVGAGSGILAMAAARLGAAEVVAVEGDPLAREAIEENVARNGVGDRVSLRLAWADVDLLASLAPRTGVVANIESGILRPLLPGFRTALGPEGGWLILSGILAAEWDGMRQATEAAGFHLVDVDADGEWRSAWFRTDGGG